MIPIAVLTRKACIDNYNYQYITEPMNLNGFKRARIALTVHGIAPGCSGYIDWEHSAVPETQQTENWVALVPTTLPASLTSKGTSTYVIDNFLPWVRLTLNIVNPSGGQLRAAEVSINGHAFENTD